MCINAITGSAGFLCRINKVLAVTLTCLHSENYTHKGLSFLPEGPLVRGKHKLHESRLKSTHLWQFLITATCACAYKKQCPVPTRTLANLIRLCSGAERGLNKHRKRPGWALAHVREVHVVCFSKKFDLLVSCDFLWKCASLKGGKKKKQGFGDGAIDKVFSLQARGS